MKLFNKLKISKDPNEQISFVKRALKKIPLEQRQLIAAQMWHGQPIEKLPLHLRPFKIMFEDANKQAIGKAWEELALQTQQFIKDQSNLVEYKKKLLNETYKNEPELRNKLINFFNDGCKDMDWFSKTIPKDIKLSRDKQFKEHLEFWCND